MQTSSAKTAPDFFGQFFWELYFKHVAFATVLVAFAFAGCGGEDSVQREEQEAQAKPARSEQINNPRYNLAKSQLRMVAEEAAEWKEEHGGSEGDFSQMVWTDIAPEEKGAAEDFQTYDGDSYTRKGWFTARITSRSPLVFVVDMERWPRRLTFTVPGTDPEAITMKEEPLNS